MTERGQSDRLTISARARQALDAGLLDVIDISLVVSSDAAAQVSVAGSATSRRIGQTPAP